MKGGRATTPSVLMVDVGWGHSFRLASDLAANGLTVYVLGGYIAKAWVTPTGVRVLPGTLDVNDMPGLMRQIDHAMAATGAHWVLPVAESILFAAWQHPSPWQHRLLPRVDDPVLRAAYGHKQRMMELLAAHGVPVPAGRWLARGDRAEIEQAGQILGWPMMVKVPDGHAGIGVVKVLDAAQAEATVRSLWQTDPERRPTLQAWASDKVWVVGGLFDQGLPLYLVAAEVVPDTHAHNGPANRLRTVDHPQLLAAARQCFKALKFSGIACVDMVGDDPDTAVLIDVNPRPWGSIGVARAAQVDLIGAWAHLLQGQPVQLPAQAPAGVEWTKLPDYLWPEGRSLRTFLRRAWEPVVWRSWSWHRWPDFIADTKRVLGTVGKRLLHRFHLIH